MECAIIIIKYGIRKLNIDWNDCCVEKSVCVCLVASENERVNCILYTWNFNEVKNTTLQSRHTHTTFSDTRSIYAHIHSRTPTLFCLRFGFCVLVTRIHRCCCCSDRFSIVYVFHTVFFLLTLLLLLFQLVCSLSHLLLLVLHSFFFLCVLKIAFIHTCSSPNCKQYRTCDTKHFANCLHQ